MHDIYVIYNKWKDYWMQIESVFRIGLYRNISCRRAVSEHPGMVSGIYPKTHTYAHDWNEKRFEFGSKSQCELYVTTRQCCSINELLKLYQITGIYLSPSVIIFNNNCITVSNEDDIHFFYDCVPFGATQLCGSGYGSACGSPSPWRADEAFSGGPMSLAFVWCCRF